MHEGVANCVLFSFFFWVHKSNKDGLREVVAVCVAGKTSKERAGARGKLEGKKQRA